MKSSNVPPGNLRIRLKGSNAPPLNSDFESNVSQNWLCRDYALFLGALLAKIWWEGAQKHFKGPGLMERMAPSLLENTEI